MKKLFKPESLSEKDSGRKQIRRVMKLTVSSLLLCSCFAFANNANSQNARVILDKRQAQLAEVLSEIESQTDYLFISNRNIDLTQKVSVRAKNESVREVLSNISKNLEVTFTTEGVNIILSKKEELPPSVDTVQQSRKVSGVILDPTGVPIIGANVVEKGTTNGTVTDIDGKFFLNVNPDARLTVTFIGYMTTEISVSGKETITLTLKEDSELLDEVIIVGFGSQKKENLTGAVSQVKMEDILGNRPVVSTMNALQGAMPGLYISGNSTPGESKSFNIRGTTSINGGEPLVLIDNVPGDIDMLNPEDIQSVSVLKDAASSAIYGARAAFGVILVTTKKAKKQDRFQLNYNNNFGFQKSVNHLEQVSAMDYLQAYKDTEWLSGHFVHEQNLDKWMQYLGEYRSDPSKFNTVGDGIYIPTEDNPEGTRYYLNEKNMAESILDNFGFLQSHNVSASGGTEKASYRLSLGYNDERGVLITDLDRYKRISAASYVSLDVTNWLTQEVDIRYASSKKSEPNGKGIYGVGFIPLAPEGEMEAADGTMLPIGTPRNGLLYATPDATNIENPRIFSKTTFKPLKGLDVVFEYTYDKKIYDRKVYDKPYNQTSMALGIASTYETSKYKNTKYTINYNAVNLFGTYGFKLGDDHSFKVMAGYNQESSSEEKLYVERLGMINEEHPSFSSATGEKVITDTYDEYAVRGAFYRINYDYKGRYLFEANGRYDGSSRFPKDSRFGFFPSFSVGWNLAKEDFMVNTESWLSELKLRASWGQIGNQSISNYAFVPTMDALLAYWISDGKRPTTLGTPALVSSRFTWETVETTDIGLDLSMLNNRFNLTADWYMRDTKDMLAPGMELPSVLGASAPEQNVADLRTKGWEISASYRDKIGDWSYNVGFNLYDSKTKITKFDNENGLLGEPMETKDEKHTNYVGRDIGEFWGYVTDGFYTVDDFENTNSWKLKEGVVSVQGINVKPGDIKYKNLNDDKNSTNQIDTGDNTLENPGDRKVIGNTTPRYHYGINLGVSWKGLALDVLLQGVGKRDYYSAYATFPFQGNKFSGLYDDQMDYWKPVDVANGDYTALNPNAKYPRIYGEYENYNHNSRSQTKYLMDASYLRIKNVTLGYTIPKTLISKIHLSSVKVFASIENLHTFTSLPMGYDPERLSWGYPFYRTVSFGFNVTF